MVERLKEEYASIAALASAVDYANKDSVRSFNALSDRMRKIVDEVVSLGQDQVREFSTLLNQESAALWVAHHLVEKGALDRDTLSRCFKRVEQARDEAASRGDFANATGEKLWLQEWRRKTKTK